MLISIIFVELDRSRRQSMSSTQMFNLNSFLINAIFTKFLIVGKKVIVERAKILKLVVYMDLKSDFIIPN